MRRICVVTGTRAEYGLLKWVMEEIQASSLLSLDIIATGMHLSPEFGDTYKEIEKDGFSISSMIPILTELDSPVGITRSMGIALTGFAEAFEKLKPDLVVLLGDRFETFSAASAALVARIPVAHIHGGELTEGAIDDAFRHAITKMSHIHFVAAKEYRQRVVQLGEDPRFVHMVGGLGVDNIKKTQLLSKKELQQSLRIQFDRKVLLITYHPVTLEDASSERQMGELLAALSELKNTTLIFTMPNADTDSRVIMRMINEFVRTHINAHAYTSLGQRRYFSCLSMVDAVIGNSSSGLLEAPSFKIPTINIGDRQKGRLQAVSVINTPPEKNAITRALQLAYSQEFLNKIKNASNPYGDGGAARKIVDILESIDFSGMLKKTFFDMSKSMFPEHL